jgi:hypothetical protein
MRFFTISSPFVHVRSVRVIEYSVWDVARRLRPAKSAAHTSSGAGISHSIGRDADRLVVGTSSFVVVVEAFAALATELAGVHVALHQVAVGWDLVSTLAPEKDRLRADHLDGIALYHFLDGALCREQATWW